MREGMVVRVGLGVVDIHECTAGRRGRRPLHNVLRAGTETRPYRLVNLAEWEVLDSAAVVDKADNFAA